MNKLKSSLAAKLIAVTLFVLLLMSLAASVLDIAYIDSINGYNYDYQTLLHKFKYDNSNDLRAVMYALGNGDSPADLNGRNGFYFVIRDYYTREVVFDGLGKRDHVWVSGPVSFEVPAEYAIPMPEAAADAGAVTPEPSVAPEPSVTPETSASPEPTASSTVLESPSPDEPDTELLIGTDSISSAGTRTYIITGYYTSGSVSSGNADKYQELFTYAYELRYVSIVVLVVSLILEAFVFVFLLSAAGHHGETGEIRPSFIDKIPFDLYTALTVFAGIFLIAAMAEVSYSNTAMLVVVLIAALGVIAALISLLWCMSLAVRIKLGTTIKSCIIYRVGAWCLRLIKKVFYTFKDGLKAIPMFPRAVLIIAAILFVEFLWIAIAGTSPGKQLFGWFIERAVLVLATLYALLSMKQLLEAGQRIAKGELDCKVDTSKLRGPFKEHGEDLNSITDGMNRAVGERMKSERFRTELITNVSHDIKTPLTSIINYVDLLEKEQPENEKMREYLEVLDRQSAKLKKLIDDLLEASKASSGSLSVNLTECELGILLDQMAGEYSEKLSAAGLELILTKPEESVKIMADGRHMWRIFDNLLNNICKYAQRGTRVYLDLTADALKAAVTFRNISATRLNISGDELTERFVRGDSSRNTEGSGLGLSIAQSLAQLQKGALDITVDGDLFKVVLSFDRIK
ncbi:MAG: histidine kinase dimerization/phospho-acceptor domain-containing protein [Candidatus Limivicinus sp.]|nr:histidine kinase dimerization/phospho-acceptor domain-containing protein [Candidatus Limivicinus sp.]